MNTPWHGFVLIIRFFCWWQRSVWRSLAATTRTGTGVAARQVLAVAALVRAAQPVRAAQRAAAQVALVRPVALAVPVVLVVPAAQRVRAARRVRAAQAAFLRLRMQAPTLTRAEFQLRLS
jgi:hypothetical protein